MWWAPVGTQSVKHLTWFPRRLWFHGHEGSVLSCAELPEIFSLSLLLSPLPLTHALALPPSVKKKKKRHVEFLIVITVCFIIFQNIMIKQISGLNIIINSSNLIICRDLKCTPYHRGYIFSLFFRGKSLRIKKFLRNKNTATLFHSDLL